MTGGARMTGPAFQITGHATVLYVKDLPVALAYYRDKLGFTGEFIWGDPPYYACLCLGDAAIHASAQGRALRDARIRGDRSRRTPLGVRTGDFEVILVRSKLTKRERHGCEESDATGPP
jgi:catechol 2,3-dioxygenase-like lactoylglutathione lyase family enzyme